jgi:hypothetical protein
VCDHQQVAVGVLDAKFAARGVELVPDFAHGNTCDLQLGSRRSYIVAIKIEKYGLLRRGHGSKAIARL